MKNTTNASKAIHRMQRSQLQEKASEDFRRFAAEKMNTDP